MAKAVREWQGLGRRFEVTHVHCTWCQQASDGGTDARCGPDRDARSATDVHYDITGTKLAEPCPPSGHRRRDRQTCSGQRRVRRGLRIPGSEQGAAKGLELSGRQSEHAECVPESGSRRSESARTAVTEQQPFKSALGGSCTARAIFAR